MAEGKDLRAAIRDAQAILAVEKTDLRIDGRWGTFTGNAYQEARASVKLSVDAVLKAHGTSAGELTNAHALAKSSGAESYQREKAASRAERGHLAMAPRTVVEQALRRASEKTGVELSVLQGFAAIESNYNSVAVNGSSKGLMQMQRGAWESASQFVDLKPYDTHWSDPFENALAGAAYVLSNSKTMRRIGYTGPISPAVLYLAHQQGPAGFVELWKAASGIRATTNYVTRVKMERNPPQDKKGVTYDKATFFRRWMAVAERKVADAG